MISNERGGTKYPQTGGMGENIAFTKQSRKKERDNGEDKTLFNHLNTGQVHNSVMRSLVKIHNKHSQGRLLGALSSGIKEGVVGLLGFFGSVRDLCTTGKAQ